jgi:hypothetical protein
MPNSSEEMHLRDIAIGLQAELNEAIFQREKFERVNAELRLEQTRLQDVVSMRDVEITAIRQSHTWKIGSLVLAPVRWIKRRKR